MHKTIIPMRTKPSLENPDEWYKYVDKVQILVNSSWQSAIRITPFELLIGMKKMQNKFAEERDDLRKIARENIIKIQDENRRYYNLRRRDKKKYNVGDLVALPVTQFGVGRKIKPKYYGPYEITKTMLNDRYEVRKEDDVTEGPRNTTTSADMLKPWSQSGRL